MLAGVGAGAGAAFAAAHGSAMVDLVDGTARRAAGGEAGWAEALAETLAMDGRRLESLGAEFEHVVRAAVVVVSARQSLAAALGPAASRDSVAAVEAAVAEAPAGAELAEVAAEAASRCGAGEAAVAAVLAAAQGRLGAPSDAVHALMRRRVRELWEAAAAGQGGQEAGKGLGLGSEAVGRRAAEGAVRLGRVAAVNREVHRAHYNRIIAEEAAALAAAGKGVFDCGEGVGAGVLRLG